jgi:hypothetical protein
MNKGPTPVPNPTPTPPVFVGDNPVNSADEIPSPVPPLLTPPSTAPGPNVAELAVVQDIIRRTEKANVVVRKYNAAKKLLREDRRCKEPVSDDEEEAPMPDITAFIRTNSTPSILITPPTTSMLSTATATSGEPTATPTTSHLTTPPPLPPGQAPCPNRPCLALPELFPQPSAL